MKLVVLALAIAVFVPLLLVLGARLANAREQEGKEGRNLGAVFVILIPALFFVLILALASA